ncbi:MAG: hypothetical protein EOP04_26685 [Proteobacteria bacterium]|nr:MAG: hypothetical protein EOP04_26685 [Pseudomonadota bacterium]
MKFLIVSVIVLFVGSAFASQFRTTATFCNGPVENGDVSTCPSFGKWGAVELKNLSSVVLPTTQNEVTFRLEDANGHSWERDLITCKSKLTDLRGCNAVSNFSDTNNISIQIQLWDIGTQIKYLSVFIKNHKELSILPPGGDHLIFSIE